MYKKKYGQEPKVTKPQMAKDIKIANAFCRRQASERIVHEQISIDADESEEKNTGIEVGMKYISVAYTQHISVCPFAQRTCSISMGRVHKKAKSQIERLKR